MILHFSVNMSPVFAKQVIWTLYDNIAPFPPRLVYLMTGLTRARSSVRLKSKKLSSLFFEIVETGVNTKPTIGSFASNRSFIPRVILVREAILPNH